MGASPPDVEALVASLRAEDQLPDGDRTALVRGWKRSVAEGELPAARLAEVGLLLLETLTEEDASLDMVAAGLLHEFAALEHLARLRAVRPNLRPRVGFRDWRHEIDRVISVVEAKADGRCDCEAEARHGAGVHASRWRIDACRDDRERYCSHYKVGCASCGRRWAVREDHGYHYPLFYWSAL